MEESNNVGELDFRQYRASQANTSGNLPPKSNFKTFSLLKKQENFNSQIESNLHKTMDVFNKNAVDDLKNNTFIVPTQETIENSYKDSQKFKITTLEKENDVLKMNVDNLERENEILKSSISTLTLSKGVSDEYKRNDSLHKAQIIEFRSKIDELTDENERLREEIIKNKENMFKRYEQLQKGNDELLISYEERVHYTQFY